VDPFTTHAETIASAIAHTCRVHRLSTDAADEFASWARLRLLDNDHAILRKFEQRSSLRTFLITVVQRLFLDWRNAEWGKWRPTADARRLGPVAIELERLVLRDQLTYDEAVQTLAARGAADARECDALWAQLPRRPRRRLVDEAAMATMPGASSASERLEDEEASAEAHSMCAALARALAALPESDRVLIQWRYWAGHTVARIATMTGENQKALYRRFDRLAADLRRRLEAEGLSGHALAHLTGRLGQDGADDSGAGPPAGNLLAGPSHLTRTGGEHG
jgi:RNA polymerase sigma factor for flagellar operon FliA